MKRSDFIRLAAVVPLLSALLKREEMPAEAKPEPAAKTADEKRREVLENYQIGTFTSGGFAPTTMYRLLPAVPERIGDGWTFPHPDVMGTGIWVCGDDRLWRYKY